MVEFALKAAQNQNGDSLALVSSEQIKEEDLKMILQRIVEKSQKQHKITVDIGIGTEVEYLEDVKISRKEAADAIRNAAMAGASGQIYRYREQGIYTLISKIQDDKFLDKYVEKQIGSLIRADALNKGNLCETLESYLNHNCNLKETAQALYIHRNTMNYRMNKIKEILGEDFENLDNCLMLKLAFIIRKLLQHRFRDRSLRNFLKEEMKQFRRHSAERHIQSALSRVQAQCLKTLTAKKVYAVGMGPFPASEIACMIVEPFQGEGGFIPAPIEWVKAVRKICDDNGILMIADEVQCGNCRTGKYFASEYWKEAGAAPDIITTAKSLGAGLPISAITARIKRSVKRIADKQTIEQKSRFTADEQQAKKGA